MSDILLISIIVVVFITMMLGGFYIHSILFGIGIMGLMYLEGFGFISGFLRADPFYQAASYSLSTIPLYIIMAQFILQAGIVQDAFSLVYKAAKGRPSILGVLTIFVGGLLGAVSGSGAATSASLGQVAVPELRSYGFKAPLAGTIAAVSGSLSGIIPPSIILILYGVITETPISYLFVGAIIPGILTMFVFMACVVVAFNMDKDKEVISTLEPKKLRLSRTLIVVISGGFIFITIFGGIYTGFVTPTEAGAVGALAAFITALVLGKVNFAFFKSTIIETAKITGMIILILIAAQIFSRFISLSLLPRKMIGLLGGLIDHKIIIIAILTLLFFLLFMFIEGSAVILMTLPVVLPIIEAAQIDTLWFGIFVAVICTLGLMTPPVGLSVYSVSATTGIPAESIFKYSISFAAVATVVVIGLMVLVPELATWLPSTITK